MSDLTFTLFSGTFNLSFSKMNSPYSPKKKKNKENEKSEKERKGERKDFKS